MVTSGTTYCYAADSLGSILGEKMPLGPLIRCFNEHNKRIQGISEPMMYVGLPMTAFPWHSEDCDLYSLNYMHSGAPKVRLKYYYYYYFPINGLNRSGMRSARHRRICFGESAALFFLMNSGSARRANICDIRRLWFLLMFLANMALKSPEL